MNINYLPICRVISDTFIIIGGQFFTYNHNEFFVVYDENYSIISVGEVDIGTINIIEKHIEQKISKNVENIEEVKKYEGYIFDVKSDGIFYFISFRRKERTNIDTKLLNINFWKKVYFKYKYYENNKDIIFYKYRTKYVDDLEFLEPYFEFPNIKSKVTLTPKLKITKKKRDFCNISIQNQYDPIILPFNRIYEVRENFIILCWNETYKKFFPKNNNCIIIENEKNFFENLDEKKTYVIPAIEKFLFIFRNKYDALIRISFIGFALKITKNLIEYLDQFFTLKYAMKFYNFNHETYKLFYYFDELHETLNDLFEEDIKEKNTNIIYRLYNSKDFSLIYHKNNYKALNLGTEEKEEMKESEKKECLICQSDIENNSDIIKWTCNCNKFYHVSCVDEMKKITASSYLRCPICRSCCNYNNLIRSKIIYDNNIGDLPIILLTEKNYNFETIDSDYVDLRYYKKTDILIYRKNAIIPLNWIIELFEIPPKIITF